ncbi:MAG: SOS response-associated peptidase [Gammaproteobacteria bacterium]|nr:SOS response-associated peptidase [Gammaproteobacteria bacterium]
MCGRYLTPDEAAFERHFGVPAPTEYFSSYNVAPSQPAPVVLIDTKGDAAGERRAEMLTWGFKPGWARRSWINARSETVFRSNAFAEAARGRRCLVASAGWYEWQGDATPKQPYVHYAPRFEPLALAGIWTSAVEDGVRRRTFAILTRPAVPEVEWVHDRMPVVLAPQDYAAWLGPDTPRPELERVLAESRPAAIETRPVSTYVNKPAHDDPRCIEPLTAGEADDPEQDPAERDG